MSKIEKKSAILDFISKFVMCCPCVTLDTLFNINALATCIMQSLRDNEQN